MINHSGTLNRDHYWLFIKDLHYYSWYSCNYKLVNIKENSLYNTTSYFFFFLTEKFKFFLGSIKDFHGFARGFCHFRHCLYKN